MKVNIVVASALLAIFLVVRGTKYHLPQGWEVKNDKSLSEIQASETGKYRLLYVGNSSLSSGSGRFGLSFFRFTNSDDYYVALIFQPVRGSGVCVWTANRDRPVSENAVFRITEQPLRALQLLDADGTLVWSSPSEVSEVDVQNSGNVVFYNSTGGISWQSFDHPTDTLLDGQVMVTGQKLVSSINSSSLASGNIRMEVEPSGTIFFVDMDSSTPQAYLVWNLWNGNLPADETSINAPCPTYRTSLTYAAGQLALSYEPTSVNPSQLCGPPLSAGLGNYTSTDSHYLKLGNDGKLAPYVYNSERDAWEHGLPFMRNRLEFCLPMTCESDRVCFGKSQCSCILENKKNGSCSSPSNIPLVCNHEVEAENHHFLNVSGAGYFSNNYTKADKVSTVRDCWDLCLSNCSCSAFFYNKQSRSCFFVKRMYGGLTKDPNFDGFLKLQNSKVVLPKKHKDHTLLLVVTVAAGFVLLSALGMVGLLVWKHKLDKVARALAMALQGSAHRYSYKELKVATQSFSNVVGEGGFGTVFQGILADGRKVAVKLLVSPSPNDRSFVAEMASLGRISHLNIVKLHGFCAEKKQPMLVYEYLENGSLDKWLFHPERCIDWKTRCDIALGLARGLAYLHGESRQLIIHLDIKPENVLLDDMFTPKLSDFGMSKLMKNRDTSQAVTAVRGTPGYLAPEWLLHSTATRKCDVYSYGMVLLELIGGRRNLSRPTFEGTSEALLDEQEQALWWYFPARVVARVKNGSELVKVVDARVRDDADETEVKRLVHVALWCIQENPSQRPSMDSVVQMFEDSQKIPEPPLYFRFALDSPGVLRISSMATVGGVSVMLMPSDLSGPR